MKKPTITPFFTFRVHVQAVRFLSFLGIAGHVYKLQNSKALKKNSTRLQSVLGFLAMADTPQYFRRTALAMAMLDRIHRICAQLHGPGEPLLVRLSKGVVMHA